ncbi:SDR family NAD(P)-dependent oxidoreductase [Spelaeicoccus albus]|uniref:NADP-dependent 3-hydroxy acid dehydrogenase YdfG n=1 Tax=Spelaeicoccus albus TaxID=1280376 RepID=A0A7Z0D035_9MICO|nr:SDR family NAD(P)-dependent oxidoreductase [Spelaeicoccus albus]NYI66879.1 NADP-dependent 3-hydroxy acid dehydrogenase YdfG [Spelaeicoccus albus]
MTSEISSADSPPSLQGKVALVTGASSGIGAAIAHTLASNGAVVAVAARRSRLLEQLVVDIESAGGSAVAIELDVTDEKACRAAVEQCVDRLGGIDVLVNNAGVMLLGPIENADVDDWRRMIDTDVLGVMYMTHAALPHLLRDKGTIVQISGVDGRTAGYLTGVYNASKWAVNAFSESLRQEVTARGVRVVVVEPGATATEISSHITHSPTRDAVEEFAAALQPLTPDDVAAATLYAVTQPPHVAVNEVLLRSVDQQR